MKTLLLAIIILLLASNSYALTFEVINQTDKKYTITVSTAKFTRDYNLSNASIAGDISANSKAYLESPLCNTKLIIDAIDEDWEYHSSSPMRLWDPSTPQSRQETGRLVQSKKVYISCGSIHKITLE